jgi:hypothetical protein
MSHSIEDVRAISQSELKPLTVTVAIARKISGLGNTTIWALIKARKLETVRVGRRTLITYGWAECEGKAHSQRRFYRIACYPYAA